LSNLLLGLDLGTSAVKVGLFDLEGNLLRQARRTCALYTPRPGWAEQEPEEWWAAVCDGLQEVLAGVDGGRIAAVGLSGQSPSHLLVTADGVSLGRAIVWSDRRAAVEAEWLAERITTEQARAWTGCTFVTGANQSSARFLWLKAHRPDDWARCAAVVQPKDFVAGRLTGQIATDVNSALGLLNPRTGRYATELLALLDIEPEKMPPALKPTTVVGYVMPEVASTTGLAPDIPVVTGTIDAWCDIIGCAEIKPGSAVDVAGTSEVVALVTAELVDGGSEGVASAPLAAGCSWVGGPMQMGGAALTWLARCFYGQEQPDFRSLEAEASAAAPGADGLLFLPYLLGERAPVWDPVARGAFVGLTDRHMRAHCFRAVYEGVAFAVRDLLERCQVAAGIAPQMLRVSGGGSGSAFWNQIKADVTGLPVQRVAVSDAACLGAALLAAVGVGVFDEFAEASGAMIRAGEVFDPVTAHASRYDELFGAWRCLYPALGPLFPRLEA
jgi:xylulokinase